MIPKMEPRVIAGMVVLAVLGVAAVAHSQEGAKPAPAAATLPGTTLAAVDLDGDLYLGDAIVTGNLTVWPVYTRKAIDPVDGEFVTLAEAQEQGLAEVRERGGSLPPQQRLDARLGNGIRRAQSNIDIGEAGASVNELVIQNKGTRPILVLAGTIVKGGKQDRQVGEDFIVPAGKTVPIAAFCVEHGRWTAQREGEDTGGKFAAQKTLATKSVRTMAQYKSDQNAVWEQVSNVNASAGKAPSTGTLVATIEDQDPAARERREKAMTAVMTRFAALSQRSPAPIGLAYAIDGKVREVRAFSHPRILGRFLETLATTVAIESDLATRQALAAKRKVYDRAADPAAVRDLVQATSKVPEQAANARAGNPLKKRAAKAGWNSDCFQDGKTAPVTRSFMSAE